MMKRMRQETPEDVQDRVWQRLSTEGLEAAAEGLIGVCRDPKATAQSKATAGRTILEAVGMLAKSREDHDPPPSEMTAAQLQAAIARLERLKIHRSGGESDDDEEGVLG